MVKFTLMVHFQVTTTYRAEVRRMENTIHRTNSGDGRQDSTLVQNQEHPSRTVKPARPNYVRPTHKLTSSTSSARSSEIISSRRPQLVRHTDSAENEVSPQFGGHSSVSDEVSGYPSPLLCFVLNLWFPWCSSSLGHCGAQPAGVGL